MKKLFTTIFFVLLLMGVSAKAQIVDVSVYDDCSRNGYTKTITAAAPATGSAEVLTTSGRTSCEYVQLWENGPKWATFNVGATITDYANLTVGADATPYYNYEYMAPYYNTANCGGLYAWMQPNYNGRQTTWTSSVTTGVTDVATTLWGSNWKTPTRTQLDTLQNSSYGKTTWTWCNGTTTQYVPGCGLKGYKVSGVGAYAEKSIFLPAAGNYYDGTVRYASSYGDYWSTEGDSDRADYLFFNSFGCSMNGYVREFGQSVRAVLIEETPEPEPEPVVDGSAEVLTTSGRTSCDYVQLWENGPKWATFNVGATITDYASLTVGADATSYYNYEDQAPYYNTANCGGLYAWMQPNYNGRQTTWTSSVTTGITDVATTLWGSNWKTPTRTQLDTLQNSSYGKTTWTWCNGTTTQYVPGCTLKGYKVSGVGAYAEKSIFLPAAGYFDYGNGTVSDASGNGNYWSSTESGSDDSDDAYYLYFDSSSRGMYDNGRKYGQSVRAVLIEKTMNTEDVTFPEGSDLLNENVTIYSLVGRLLYQNVRLSDLTLPAGTYVIYGATETIKYIVY